MPQKLLNPNSGRVKQIVRAVTSTPWAIEPTKLEEIRELLELRSRGEMFTAEEIRQRIGGDPEDGEGPQLVGRVAVLPLCGVMAPKMNLLMEISGGTSTEQFGQWFREAAADSQVAAIVMSVDSPGGSAFGLAELVDQINAHRGDKPVIAVVSGLCASAAYFVASAADEIVAGPSSLVGSIGTLLVHSEQSALDSTRGVKFTTFSAGKHKADGDSHQPLSAQAKATLQERVDDYYAQFVSAVAANRGVSAETVKAEFGQGKAWIATKALAAGMIDRLGTLEEVVTLLNGQHPPKQTSGGGFLKKSPTHSTTQETTNREEEPVLALPNTGASSLSTSQQEKRTVNKKIKAALYARDIIDSLECSDELAQTALKATFAAHGQAVPTGDEAILAALARGFAPTAKLEQVAEPLKTLDETKIRQQAAGEERIRQNEIRAAGVLLEVSEAEVTAAIESGEPIEKVRSQFVGKKTAGNKPIVKDGLEMTGSGMDVFTVGAEQALLERLGMRNQSQPLSPAARELRNTPLLTIAQEQLRLQGHRVRGTNEEQAAAWLALGGNYAPMAHDGTNFQRASDFPNLLSNLMGKVLDLAIELAQASYPYWTARLPDIADLKPKTIVAIGQLDQLDRLADDQIPESLKYDEEAPGWVQIDRYGNRVGLTPVMVANDDLDSFQQGLMSLGHAHEMTLNRLCLSLLTGNVALLDTYNLFDDTYHKNDLTSGGTGPSAAATDLMRQKHRQQTGVGGKGKVRTPPKIALVPTHWETAAEQAYLPLAGLPENKVPVSDATLNTFRGKIVPVCEPELDDNDLYFWYTFADPKLRRTIVHAFQTGYGEMGKRTSYFDPATETRFTRLEGRFAAAVAGFRGVVRNKGQA